MKEKNQILARKTGRPFLVAGPCSAESEQQVMETAAALASDRIDLFRAGIWKPRTRPGVFEGIGSEGLSWLSQVKEKFGIATTTEVANARHVESALAAGIDVLWIGARTTANPFSVQEIADALQGSSVPVLIKNPVNPDLHLWLGAVERIEQSGTREIGLVHRGFSFFNNKKYRNSPLWQIPIDLRSERPDLLMICDISHISGDRSLLKEVGQVAMDLAYDGLMVEVHHAPDDALSDGFQQIEPGTFSNLIRELVYRRQSIDIVDHDRIEQLRRDIDALDEEMIVRLARRMRIVENLGEIKAEYDIPVLQPLRWRKILLRAVEQGTHDGLSSEFIEELFKAIHQESISHQLQVMNSMTRKGQPLESHIFTKEIYKK